MEVIIILRLWSVFVDLAKTKSERIIESASRRADISLSIHVYCDVLYYSP